MVFNGTIEAPTVVTGVQLIPENSSYYHPSFCEVNVTIDTYTGSTYRLPADVADWTEIYTLQGCGGFCGFITMDGQPFGRDTNGTSWSRDLIRKGFVATHTNMGWDRNEYSFKGDGTDNWKIFKDNRTAEINWAYRSTHLTIVTGKAITEMYYGRAPRLSLYRGGSTGGRQGLVEMQRFSADFDGLIIGHPTVNQTGVGILQYAHWALQNRDPDTGCALLTGDDMDLLHEAVLESCDANDGLKDGVVTNGDHCDIKWELLSCCSSNTTRITDSDNCFSAKQIRAAKGLFTAHTMPGGNPATGTMWPGTESKSSFGSFLGGGADGCSPSAYWNGTIDRTFHVGYEDDHRFPEDWVPTDFDWEKNPRNLGYMEAIFTGGNADATMFRNRGGKVIFSQGEAGTSGLETFPGFILIKPQY